MNRSTLTASAIIGGVILALSAPLAASAHHPEIVGVANCNTTTGEFDITWTVQSWNTGYAGTVTASYNQLIPVGTAIGEPAEFIQTGASLGTNSLRVDMRWDNRATGNRTGTVEVSGECSIPKPDPKEPLIEFGEWSDAAVVCDATTVATSREVHTTTYSYDPVTNSYIADETVTTSEDSTRELTPEEVEQNLCPTPPAPPTDIQLPTVPVAELARTGFPVIPVALFGAALLGLGALMKKKGTHA